MSFTNTRVTKYTFNYNRVLRFGQWHPRRIGIVFLTKEPVL